MPLKSLFLIKFLNPNQAAKQDATMQDAPFPSLECTLLLPSAWSTRDRSEERKHVHLKRDPRKSEKKGRETRCWATIKKTTRVAWVIVSNSFDVFRPIVFTIVWRLQTILNLRAGRQRAVSIDDDSHERIFEIFIVIKATHVVQLNYLIFRWSHMKRSQNIYSYRVYTFWHSERTTKQLFRRPYQWYHFLCKHFKFAPMRRSLTVFRSLVSIFISFVEHSFYL